VDRRCPNRCGHARVLRRRVLDARRHQNIVIEAEFINGRDDRRLTTRRWVDLSRCERTATDAACAGTGRGLGFATVGEEVAASTT
jgi:hypothetical protein